MLLTEMFLLKLKATRILFFKSHGNVCLNIRKYIRWCCRMEIPYIPTETGRETNLTIWCTYLVNLVLQEY